MNGVRSADSTDSRDDDSVARDDRSAPTVSPSIGQRLRDAREAHGRTVEDVSEALRFGVAQIRAIESGDFEALPGTTFVRGMIRSYSKYVGLDADLLLQGLGTMYGNSTDALVPPSNIGNAIDEGNLYRGLSGRVLGAIALLLIGAALIYFGISTDYSNVLGYAPAQSAPIPRPLSSESPVQVAAANVGGDDAPRLEAVPSKSLRSGQSSFEESTPENLLNLHFTDLSWIEVKDGSGAILLAGEFGPGTSRAITGVSPIYIWVGRASAVSASLRGQSIDLLGSARDGVARVVVNLPD